MGEVRTDETNQGGAGNQNWQENTKRQEVNGYEMTGKQETNYNQTLWTLTVYSMCFSLGYRVCFLVT